MLVLLLELMLLLLLLCCPCAQGMPLCWKAGKTAGNRSGNEIHRLGVLRNGLIRNWDSRIAIICSVWGYF